VSACGWRAVSSGPWPRAGQACRRRTGVAPANSFDPSAQVPAPVLPALPVIGFGVQHVCLLLSRRTLAALPRDRSVFVNRLAHWPKFLPWFHSCATAVW
jgi:hypothetical protein